MPQPSIYIFTAEQELQIRQLRDQAEIAIEMGNPVGAYSPMYEYIAGVIRSALEGASLDQSQRSELEQAAFWFEGAVLTCPHS